MTGKVSILITKGGTGVTLYTQYLSEPDNVNTAINKMYISAASSLNWNCEQAQLLLDTIQSSGGLTVTCFTKAGLNLGPAVLTTYSSLTANCGVTDEATLVYDPLQTTGQVIKTSYITWIGGVPTETARLDLYPDETISQNWEFKSISNFQSRAGYTREFRIPMTELNQALLDHAPYTTYSPGNTDIFDSKNNAVILVDELPLVRGFLRVNKIVTQSDVRADAEVTFYTDVPDLFTLLRGKKFVDLDALQDLNHDLDQTYIDTQPNEYVLYSMIDRGSDNDLQVSELNTSEPSLAIKQSPSVRWDWLLKSVVEEAGFTLNAPELLAILGDIWAPWLGNRPFAYNNSAIAFRAVVNFTDDYPRGFVYWGDDYGWGWDGIYPGYGPSVPPSPITPWLEVVDVLNAYSNNIGPNNGFSYYTAPYDGFFLFDLWATWDWDRTDSTTVTLSLLIQRPNGDYFIQSAATANTVSIAANSAGTYFHRAQVYAVRQPGMGDGYFLEAGSKVFFFLKFSDSLGVGGGNTIKMYAGASTGFVGTGWELVSINTFALGNLPYPVDMQESAPDVNQIDFVSDVLKMFNCVIEGDKLIPNQINIAPMIDYLGTGETIDWTDKIVIDKDYTMSTPSDELNQQLTMSYKDGKDIGNQTYVSVGNRVYGSYQVVGYTETATDTPHLFATGEYKVQLTAIATPCNAFPGTAAVMPRFVDSANKYVPPGLRALYWADTYYRTDGTWFRLLNHYSTTYADYSDSDLNFAPETPLFNIITNPVNNLFNVYWRAFFDEIYSKRARILEAFVMMDTTDVLEFSFKNYYWFFGCYWRITKITDYKHGADMPTKVTFMKVINPVQRCQAIPISSNRDGSLNWVDGDGNPVVGTQDCCDQLGLSWSEQKSKCFGQVAGGTNAAADGVRYENVLTDITKPLVKPFDLVRTENSKFDITPSGSVIIGESFKVDTPLFQSIMIGRRHEVSNAGTGLSIFGSDAKVVNTGNHFGGGTRGSVGNIGSIQSGSVLLGNKTIFAATGVQIQVSFGGSILKRLVLPEDTTWICRATVIASDTQGFWVTSYWTFVLNNKGGTLDASTPVMVSEDDWAGGEWRVTPVINLITNPGEFTLYVRLDDIGATPNTYPTPALNITLGIDYTQTR